ncbi:leucyl aminopeptidase family protein [Phaeovulum sp.]|uniref:leucyl aminopeptidase family protein n=1 Tax=Phaeovulum sp. TaxID=2934796 RepID=UPI00272FA47D|nr:leucyl aminopeptidase family protein [Phaeovulum sp.]MDP1668834.1 leucyl aminopeptidase family protein [Phaeovulum sp.]MDZ4117884.1 leucyl aminopeptidase family protein [Phaeovulum sp.]
MPLHFADPAGPSLPLTLVPEAGLVEALARLPDAARRWAEAQGFAAKLGQCCVLPDAAGAVQGALFGLGTPAARARGRFHLATAAEALPAGAWHLDGALALQEAEEAALGWLLSGYRFGRYKAATPPKATLKCPAGVNAARLEAIAAGEALTRDLINTPASDMGPDELEAAFTALAARHGASTSVVAGEALLTGGLPMIHAVGRASPRAPRLLDLRWGNAGPRLTLVGKGVCFDTGGLDLKPAAGMGLMKKDMGGAATVMGLAEMIMALGLPIRLRVLVPAVENAVSGNAFRPQDILTSRKGLTVEVNNTDAEGRLVLADALALADEETPDLLLCMATLTGAARVALGPDVPPFYTDDEPLAAALATAAARVADPLWRMPFWTPYEGQIEPGIADLDNAPSGGMAGSVTAALFLRRFVTATPRFAHFDIYGWQPVAAPARPKGAVGQGARAILDALPEVFGL